ncbi:hypothetical protein [Acidipropionibacterium timonense]|uniref:hypothetical protein n=1 Tax=Acidipropionibacterium timonense TaxID=2161818 RepID=UPI00102FE85A|nr:hypothetical protein [Acidipropionibacterium timonense]
MSRKRTDSTGTDDRTAPQEGPAGRRTRSPRVRPQAPSPASVDTTSSASGNTSSTSGRDTPPSGRSRRGPVVDRMRALRVRELGRWARSRPSGSSARMPAKGKEWDVVLATLRRRATGGGEVSRADPSSPTA